jgi:hypothetical protein
VRRERQTSVNATRNVPREGRRPTMLAKSATQPTRMKTAMTIEIVGRADVLLGHAKTYANGNETEQGSEIIHESSETEKVGEM